MLLKNRNYLLYLLARQDYSRKSLKEKLNLRKELTNQEIDSLLDEFSNKGWQCDKRYADLLINSQINKLKGKKTIRQIAIHQKGISDEIVDFFLNDDAIDWEEICLGRYIKKYKNIPCNTDIKEKNKRTNYLLYHGFSFSEVDKVLKKSEEILIQE